MEILEEHRESWGTRGGFILAAVGSAVVGKSLKHDLDQLADTVNETFAGAPAAVAVKQKKVSKSMQYRAYEERRSN